MRGLCDLGRRGAEPMDRLTEGSVPAMVRAVPCRSLPFPAVTRRGPHLVPREVFGLCAVRLPDGYSLLVSARRTRWCEPPRVR